MWNPLKVLTNPDATLLSAPPRINVIAASTTGIVLMYPLMYLVRGIEDRTGTSFGSGILGFITMVFLTLGTIVALGGVTSVFAKLFRRQIDLRQGINLNGCCLVPLVVVDLAASFMFTRVQFLNVMTIGESLQVIFSVTLVWCILLYAWAIKVSPRISK